MEKEYCNMPFGKYKGQCITMLPLTYIAWLLAKDIPKGRLKEDLREYVWNIEKNKYIDAIVNEWVYENYQESNKPKSSSIGSSCAYDYDSNPLWDAMDGCLPNQ